ncbi:haloacid dehalogenase-like hydrolase family protein [Mycena leptocephala]|nr:haloacid dehalogenase-like hydrolase family protein [Mycena leptocephala]
MPKITTLLLTATTHSSSPRPSRSKLAELANEILESQGISDRYTGHALFTEFVGQNFRGMMSSLQKKYSSSSRPLRLTPVFGADTELARLAASGRFEMAVVSSSAGRRVEASVDKVGMEPTSKPDPAIYLHACKVMGKEPGECVAIEDSKNGTLSAVRAGIHTVGYVGSYEPEQQDEMRGVLKEAGADPVMADWAEFAACLDKIEKRA